MKRLLYVLAFSFIAFYSCSEKWDEHFGDGEQPENLVSELNLLDYLKTIPEYSEFVKALEETGVAEELTREQNLTVWAVDNEAMAELAAMEFLSDTFVMAYHINNLSFGKVKLSNGLRLRSLNGKYISVREIGDSSYVAEVRIINSDQFCSNGVVHEIEHLMEPVIGLYEYLEALGPEYSTIVDTIFNANEEVFDVENSVPVGVDPTGNTIYDSVFVTQNPLFETIDFRSEFEQTTMLLPSNAVINECLASFGAQLTAMGRPFTMEDTILAMSWIKEALFYEGIFEDYYGQQDLISAFDKVWRTSIQEVDTEYKTMSNGVVYEVSKMKIPNNVYITRIKSLVHYYEFIPEENRPDLIEAINALTYFPKTTDSWDFSDGGYGSGVYKIVQIDGASPSDDLPLAFEFSPLKIETLEDNTILATEMLIPAGEYKWYMGFRSKNHAYVNFYFNGGIINEEVNVSASTPWNYDRVTETVYKKYDGLGGLIGIVNVPGSGLQSVKMKVEFNRLGGGSQEQLQLYHWALVPTENNY